MKNGGKALNLPIYRVVNAVDAVTFLPPSGIFINLICGLLKLIDGILPLGIKIDRLHKWIENKFGGYYHGGDMRYLTNVQDNNYDNVELLYNQNILRRFQMAMKKDKGIKEALKDHNIGVYRRKLLIIAQRKN